MKVFKCASLLHVQYTIHKFEVIKIGFVLGGGGTLLFSKGICNVNFIFQINAVIFNFLLIKNKYIFLTLIMIKKSLEQ